MMRAALENGCPFELALYAASDESGKFALAAIKAAMRFDGEKRETIASSIDFWLRAGKTPYICKAEIDGLSSVPESMQSSFLWEGIGWAFDLMLKSKEPKEHAGALEILSIIPDHRRARFVKSALETSVIPIDVAISSLCSMKREFQTEELWEIARTEFDAMANSGDRRMAKSAKRALGFIPSERKGRFQQEAGWKDGDTDQEKQDGADAKESGAVQAEACIEPGKGDLAKRIKEIFSNFCEMITG